MANRRTNIYGSLLGDGGGVKDLEVVVKGERGAAFVGAGEYE